MATNRITITITECGDATGYIVYYRPVGSSGPYRQSPVIPPSTSLVVTDASDPANTQYEGYFISICPAGNSSQVPFTTATPYTWEGINPTCQTALTCPTGYTLSGDQTTCVKNNPSDPGPANYPPSLLNNGTKIWNDRRRTPGGYEEPNIDGVGVGPYIAPITDTDFCTPGEVTIPPFDYLVLKYSWPSTSGNDLDTMTGFIDTGTVYDNTYVGFGGSQVPGGKIPAGSLDNDAYLFWGSDNTGSGTEAILANFKKFTEIESPVPDILKVTMFAVWYGTKLTGDISVEIVAYIGGVMNKVGFDFVNVGGTQVYQQILNTNVQANNQAANVASATNVAIVSYSQSAKTASISLV